MNNQFDSTMVAQLAAIFGVPPETIKKMLTMLPGVSLSVDHGPITGDQYEALGAHELDYPIAKRNNLKIYKYYSDVESPETGVNYSRQSLEDGVDCQS